ncbi:MAG: host attachment protein [Gammaproteobacteria bacterium]
MSKLWVVVAESSRARIFSVVNRISPLAEIDDLVNPAARSHDRDLTSDTPGRSFDSAGLGRHAMEPATDPKKNEVIVFARKIGERLGSARKAGEFDELILICSPEFLGLLRQNLDDVLKKHVTKTINKNLIHKDEAQIREYLF